MKFYPYIFITLLFQYSFAYAQQNTHYEDAYKTFEDGKIDDAYIHLKNSLNLYPQHLPSKILMGQVLGLSGFYDDAQAEFEESLMAGADPNLILEPYVKVLFALNQREKIIDLQDKQLTSSKRGFLYSAKAIASKQLEKLDDAHSYHQKALAIAPNSLVVLNGAATFYLDTGELETAKNLLDKALAQPEQAAESYKLYGKYHAKLGQTKQQIAMLKRGLDISVGHPLILRDLVTAYTSIEDYVSAKKIIEQTLQQLPSDPMAKLLLSWVATELNQTDLAQNTLDDLVNNLSLLDSSDLSKNLGMLFVSAMANYAAGNSLVAQDQFEQFLAQKPRNFAASQLLIDIYQQNRSYVSAANLMEKFIDEVEQDISLVARLCSLYTKANQNHKCDNLLMRTRQQFGEHPIYVQTQAQLFEARGKLELALESLDRLTGTDVGVTIQRAIVAIRSNELNEADGYVDELLSLDPNDVDYLNLKASILKKRNSTFTAKEIYQQILRTDPSHFSASFNLASLYLGQGEYDSALKITSNLLESRPDDVSLLVLHARILARLNKQDLAIEALNTADILDRNSVDVAEAYIEYYMYTEQFKSALAKVNKLQKDDLTNTRLMRLNARIKYALGKNEEALQQLRLVFGAVSDNVGELYQLSLLQSEYNSNRDALKSLQRAQELDNNNFFVKRDIARIALLMQNYDLTETTLRGLNKSSPTNPDVILLNADLLRAKNKLSQAASRYHSAVRQSNQLAPALIGSYQLALAGYQTDAFVRLFDSLASSPNTNTFATHLLADYYFSQKQYSKAKDYYVSISNALPYGPLPMVLNNLANIYILENKIDAAYNFAQQAYELSSNNAYVLDTLGWIHTLQGKYNEALNLLRKAYSFNAQDGDMRYHIAYTLFKLGRKAESKRELKILLSDFPEFDAREDALSLQYQLNL